MPLACIGSCSSAQLPVEFSENILQNLFHNLPPQSVCNYSFIFKNHDHDRYLKTIARAGHGRFLVEAQLARGTPKLIVALPSKRGAGLRLCVLLLILRGCVFVQSRFIAKNFTFSPPPQYVHVNVTNHSFLFAISEVQGRPSIPFMDKSSARLLNFWSVLFCVYAVGSVPHQLALFLFRGTS